MSNDLWRTPDWLYNALNATYGPFDVDLAADAENTKCEKFYSIQTNALVHDWHLAGKNGFCNPPYSNLSLWLQKAKRESTAHKFRSTFVLPVWNGEQYWLDAVYRYGAREVRQIFGRIAFIDWNGLEVSGNRGGTVIVHYGKKPPAQPHVIYIERDSLIRQFS